MIGLTRKYQFTPLTRPTTIATAATFCDSGALVTELRMSCRLSATVSSRLRRIIGGAADLPIDRSAVVLLRSLLDEDAAEVLRGLQLLGEAGEVLVGHGLAVHHHVAALLRVLGQPHPGGKDGRQLVHHLHRAGAALLERVEDLQLVLERLLVLGDGLHLADGLLQFRDLRIFSFYARTKSSHVVRHVVTLHVVCY